ncbi:MAG: hypothetical protein L0206_21585 [Actinobacteria bacterium]|nr:hypothetical protein [Actinomycetota bacterium]
MALAVWPVDLPQSPLFEGTEESLVDTRVGFQPDAGPSQVMSIFTRGIKKVTYGIGPLRDYHKDLLDVFVEETLVGGTQFFEWASPAWNSQLLVFKFVALPVYQLKIHRSTISEAASSENAGAGYVTWTGKIQRKWFTLFSLARFPWYPAA